MDFRLGLDVEGTLTFAITAIETIIDMRCAPTAQNGRKLRSGENLLSIVNEIKMKCPRAVHFDFAVRFQIGDLGKRMQAIAQFLAILVEPIQM